MATIVKNRLKSGGVSYTLRIRLAKGAVNLNFGTRKAAEDEGARITAIVRDGKWCDTIAEHFRRGTWTDELHAALLAGTYNPKEQERAEARAKEEAERAEAERQKRLFTVFVQRYLKEKVPFLKAGTQETERPRLLWWESKLGNFPIEEIYPHVSSLLAELQTTGPGDSPTGKKTHRKAGKPVSSTTARHYLKTLRALLGVCRNEWKIPGADPKAGVSKMPKPLPPRIRFLSFEERQKLLQTCENKRNPFTRTIALLLLTTGARFAEITGLRWDWLNLREGLIHLPASVTKAGKARTLFLSGEPLEILQKMSKERTVVSPYVFPSKKNPTKPTGSIRRSWAKALEDAGISNFHVHDMRHDAASCLIQNGCSLAEVAEFLGHADYRMVKVYAHLDQSKLAETVRKVNQTRFAAGNSEKK